MSESPQQNPNDRFPAYDMGAPLVDVTKALQLAGEMEDTDLLSRLPR